MLQISGAPVQRKKYIRVPMRDGIGMVSAFIHGDEYVAYRPLHGPAIRRQTRAEIIADELGGEAVSYEKNGYTVWIVEMWFTK